jgi:hypothetical protein
MGHDEKEREMNAECWVCSQPIRSGERVNRPPQGTIAVHTDCLRHDALVDGALPGDEDLRGAA